MSVAVIEEVRYIAQAYCIKKDWLRWEGTLPSLQKRSIHHHHKRQTGGYVVIPQEPQTAVEIKHKY